MELKQSLTQKLRVAAKKQSFFTRFKTTYRPIICPFEELLPLVPEGSKVLDIGCGSGVFLYLINKFRQPNALCGVDINKRALDEAKLLFSSSDYPTIVELELLKNTNLQEKISAANFISLIDVIHHIPKEQQMQFVVNIFANSKKGTKILIKDIDKTDRMRQAFNKLHDLILAREWVNETTPEILESWIGNQATMLNSHKSKRGPYAHFWFLLQK